MSYNNEQEKNKTLSSLNDTDNSSITKVEETSEEQEEEEKTEKPELEEIPSGYIEGQKVIIKSPLAQTLHEKGYFGDLKDPEELHLSPVEAIFLVERKKLQVFQENEKPLFLSEIVTIFGKEMENLWTNYLVYRDLRSRGYIVKQGYGAQTSLGPIYRLYPRGGAPGKTASKVLIATLIEGKKVKIEDLDYMIKQALASRKKLALAVVDEVGDVTYYLASELELNKNKKVKKTEEKTGTE
ncbi:MAG: tRNA-intron lyase [Candidatus Hodarchaeota archaeon]